MQKALRAAVAPRGSTRADWMGRGQSTSSFTDNPCDSRMEIVAIHPSEIPLRLAHD
jgi:hypothetical protein